MDTEYNLGTYLKEKRLACGKTITQVENESGVPDTTYKRIANGSNNPQFSTAVALIKAVDGSVDELVGIAPKADANSLVAIENEGLRKQLDLMKAENDSLRHDNGAKSEQIASYDRLLAEKEKAKEWLKKIIKILSIICGLFVLVFVGLYIYDITHLDRGFFQMEQAMNMITQDGSKGLLSGIFNALRA